jgi:4-oxalocrotonate tautomerase
MPIAIIHMMEGRDDQKKARAIAAVTQAIIETLDAKPESVRVILQEYPKTHWGIAGKPVGSPADAKSK